MKLIEYQIQLNIMKNILNGRDILEDNSIIKLTFKKTYSIAGVKIEDRSNLKKNI